VRKIPGRLEPVHNSQGRLWVQSLPKRDVSVVSVYRSISDMTLRRRERRKGPRLCEKGSVFGANLYRDVGVAITEHQSAQNRLPDCPSCAMTRTAVADFIMQVLAQLPKPRLTWPRR
jgi:hypothetical protein